MSSDDWKGEATGKDLGVARWRVCRRESGSVMLRKWHGRLEGLWNRCVWVEERFRGLSKRKHKSNIQWGGIARRFPVGNGQTRVAVASNQEDMKKGRSKVVAS